MSEQHEGTVSMKDTVTETETTKTKTTSWSFPQTVWDAVRHFGDACESVSRYYDAKKKLLDTEKDLAEARRKVQSQQATIQSLRAKLGEGDSRKSWRTNKGAPNTGSTAKVSETTSVETTNPQRAMKEVDVKNQQAVSDVSDRINSGLRDQMQKHTVNAG